MGLNSHTRLVAAAQNHPGWETEEFQETKVVSSGEKFSIFGERSGIDEAQRRPDPFTGGTQD